MPAQNRLTQSQVESLWSWWGMSRTQHTTLVCTMTDTTRRDAATVYAYKSVVAAQLSLLATSSAVCFWLPQHLFPTLHRWCECFSVTWLPPTQLHRHLSLYLTLLKIIESQARHESPNFLRLLYDLDFDDHSIINWKYWGVWMFIWNILEFQALFTYIWIKFKFDYITE